MQLINLAKFLSIVTAVVLVSLEGALSCHYSSGDLNPGHYCLQLTNPASNAVVITPGNFHFSWGLIGSCPRNTSISFVVCKNDGSYALTLGEELTQTSGALSANVTWKYPHQTHLFPSGIYTLFVVDQITFNIVGLSTNLTVEVKS